MKVEMKNSIERWKRKLRAYQQVEPKGPEMENGTWWGIRKLED